MKVSNQHGDLILKTVNVIPKTAKKIELENNSFVVEKGEGVHTHCLVADKLTDNVDIYQDGETLFLSVKKLTELRHEEHGTQVLEPGIYRKVIEREFDYESMEARQTRD